MNNHPPLNILIYTVACLGILWYGSIHLAFAQPIADDPLLHSRIAPGMSAAALPQPLFQPAKSFALTERPDAEAVGIGDFNHDGYQDVAVTAGTYAPNYLYIFLQGEDGQLQTPELYPADVQPEAIAVGDLNGDGWDDVAVVSVADNRVAVYLQTRDGKLAERRLYVTERTPDAIAIADFNQDGRDDVVVSHGNHPSVGILLQQEDGTLANMVPYAAPQAGHDDIDIGDVNGDALPDVVKLNGQGISANLSVLLQTISGTLELPLPQDISGAITRSGVAVGDVTGDSRADVVVTH